MILKGSVNTKVIIKKQNKVKAFYGILSDEENLSGGLVYEKASVPLHFHTPYRITVFQKIFGQNRSDVE